MELASATCCVPLQGGYGLPLTIVGRPLTNGPYHGGGGWMTASPGYFEVFKIPVKRGRVFTERDDKAGLPVVVINEAMAKQFWPNGDPLSDKLVIGHGVMREFAARTRTPDHRRRRRHASGQPDDESGTDDVHSAGAGPRRGERAERRPDADGVDCPNAHGAAIALGTDPGAAA